MFFGVEKVVDKRWRTWRKKEEKWKRKSGTEENKEEQGKEIHKAFNNVEKTAVIFHSGLIK